MNLIRADVPELSLLEIIRQCNMPGIQVASGPRLTATGAINLCIWMNLSSTRVTVGAVDTLLVLMLLGTICNDRLIKSIYHVKEKIHPYYALPVPISSLDEVQITIVRNKSDIREERKIVIANLGDAH